MRRVTTMVAVVALTIGPSLPVLGAPDNLYVYLQRDSSGRFRPHITDGGSTSVLADIDSITSPAISADGSRVAFSGAVGDETLGLFAIFTVNPDGTGLAQVTGGEFAEFDPSWSPDGASIVFSRDDTANLSRNSCCRLAKVDLGPGNITNLTGSIGAARPEYSPDGSLIVFDNPSGIWTMPAGGGTATRQATQGWDATFSPLSDAIAYVAVAGSDHVLRVLTIPGGSVRDIYSTASAIESPMWVNDRIYFIEHAGNGYDGRTNVRLRSVDATGSGVRTERAFGSVVAGLSMAGGQGAVAHAADVDADGDLDLAVTGPLDRVVYRSTGSSFQTENWGALTPTTTWNIHLVGDFNGDGRDDTASHLRNDGTWRVAVSSGSSYSTSVWADYSTASGWSSQLVGDFNGDGRDDIANFHPANGTWWVSRSTGSSFTTSLWADFSTASGWSSQIVGDFDGDGRDDIANFHPSNGTWWVSRSTGSSFTTSLWADFATAKGWKTHVVGDFDGDGRDDIANFHPSNGTWWVSLSTGSGFTTRLWADFATAKGWSSQIVGDFDGDGRDDIANFHPSNGTWWVSRSTGSSFTTSLWADFSTASGWVVQIVGDFSGDGRDDIANRHFSNDWWWVSRSTGSSFTTSRWAP